MRLAPAAIVLAALWLGGCAENAFDCAVGTPSDNCKPGSAGHQAKMQLRQDDKVVGEMDDARCLVYTDPGTAAYAECRRRKAAVREAFEAPKPR